MNTSSHAVLYLVGMPLQHSYNIPMPYLSHSYVLFTLDKLIVDNYIIVYLHSGAPRHSMPSLSILHKFYEMVDHRY